MEKTYAIEMVGLTDLENHTFEDMPLEEAKSEIKRLKVQFPDRKFFLVTGGNGGVGCYLNPDGNHSITGKAW
jgi:hypothetical protein